MTDTEEFIRAVYRMTDGDVLDVEGWRGAFTEDGVFTVAGGSETFTGDEVVHAVSRMATVLPDIHREVLRVHVAGDVVVAETLTTGTHLGPFRTPAGPIAPTGVRISVPSADFIHLRDGKIALWHTYVMQNLWYAQLGVHYDFAAAMEASAATG